MKLIRTLLWATGAWLTTISSLHIWLNLGGVSQVAEGPSFRVGFLPVT